MAAAAVLLLAAGIATAALLLREPLLVGSNPGGLGRAGEIGLRSRLDFETAGIGPQSEVRTWVSFVLPGDTVGCGALVKRDDGHQDFVAFGANGEPLWVASRNWSDWTDTLDSAAVYPSGVRSLVVRREADRPIEALIFVLIRKMRTALVVVEPASGRRMATVFHDGHLTDDGAGLVDVAVFPGTARSDRSLLFAGQHWVDGDAAPCVLVLSPDGRILQHLRLPSIGLLPPDSLRTQEVRVDWALDRPEATIETSEHILLSFLLKDGLLDWAGVRVLLPDHLATRYDERFGPEAFRTRVQEAGGEEVFTKSLASEVKDLSLEAPRGWRGK